MKNAEIEDVELENVTEYFQMMLDLGWKRNSIIRKSTALRELFKFLGKQNYRVLSWELIPIPEREYVKPRIADHGDYLKMVRAFTGDDRRTLRNLALSMLLWDSMCRIGEILSLNIDDIDTSEKRGVVKTEKSRGVRPMREIFWSKETNDALIEWIEKREYYRYRFDLFDDKALFIGLSGQKRGIRMHPNSVREIFRLACKRAGVEYINPHSMRHAGGMELATKGANNSVISSILGHSSLLASFVYTRIKDKQLHRQWDKYRS